MLGPLHGLAMTESRTEVSARRTCSDSKTLAIQYLRKEPASGDATIPSVNDDIRSACLAQGLFSGFSIEGISAFCVAAASWLPNLRALVLAGGWS